MEAAKPVDVADGRIKVALIGLGDIGASAHLPAILADGGAELVAVCDLEPSAVQAAVAGLEDRVTATFDAGTVIADRTVEAIVLATPPWITKDLAPAALRAGKYVLAEKPLAPSMAGMVAFEKLEPAAAARLQVGFTFRHHPSIERVRDLARQEALGRPLLIRVSGYDGAATTGSVLGGIVLRHLEHGMPIVHEGAHFCDWINLILGAAPVEVRGMACQTDRAFPSPNLNVAMARYRDGSVVLVEAGWLAPALPVNYFTVTGSRGHVVIDPETMELSGVVSGVREYVEGTTDRHGFCFALQLRRFLDSVRRGSVPVPGLADGIASLEFTDQLVQYTVAA